MTTEKYRLLLNISNRFLKTGFSTVSMDNLARELKVSKKTIYKHFSSKAEIIEEIIKGIKLNLNRNINKLIGQNTNSVEKLHLVGIVIVDLVNNVSKTWLNDLKHHNQNLWNEYDEFRNIAITQAYEEVIKQGLDEKLLKKTSSNVISSITYSGLKELGDRKAVSEKDPSFEETSKEFLKIIIRGILTQKGRKEFDKVLSKNGNSEYEQ